jgi:hypothetical protein
MEAGIVSCCLEDAIVERFVVDVLGILCNVHLRTHFVPNNSLSFSFFLVVVDIADLVSLHNLLELIHGD